MSTILKEKYIKVDVVKNISAHIIQDQFASFSIKGMTGSLSTCVIAATHDISKKPFVVVYSDKEEAAYAYNDLQQLLPEEQVLFFPSSGQRFIKTQTQQINTLDRTLVLKALSKPSFKSIIVTYSEAIMELTSIASDVKEMSIALLQGEEMIMDLLVEELNERKFERSDFVYEPGQFSWRGGIIDVFSYTSELPFRIEFNGDVIDSIRTFDSEDQLSKKQLKKASITPDISKIGGDVEHLFFENLPQNTTLWVKDLPIVFDHFKTLNQKWQENNELEQIKLAELERLKSSFNSFQLLQFGNNFGTFESHSFTINSSPQPSFNKQFELSMLYYLFRLLLTIYFFYHLKRHHRYQTLLHCIFHKDH